VWRDTIDDDERTALAPGRPPDLDLRPDVLVVGGGVMGLWVAAMCRRAGVDRVVVIEADQLASAASGGAAAALSPEPHVWTEPEAFVRLGRESLDLYRRFDDEWGGGFELRTLRWLIALGFPVPDELRAGPGVQVLDQAGVEELEPELSGVRGGLVHPDQAHLNPLKLAVALSRRAGQVVTGVSMHGVLMAKDKVTVVHSSAGDFEPGVVVFATGSLPEVGRASGMGVPLGQRMVKGHLIATEPAPFRLEVAIAAPEGLVIQLEDGRLVCGGTLDEDDSSREVRPEVVAGIRSELERLIPATAALATSHAWCCFRPFVAGGLPVIDRLGDNAWATAGHYRTGILMAPATGEALAGWITTGARPDSVSAFGLSRLEGA
jgi:glycine oxidase